MNERLTIYGAATRYGVATCSIYSWLNKGWMPKPHKLGGRSFWFTDDLDAWDALGNPRPCDEEEKEFSK